MATISTKVKIKTPELIKAIKIWLGKKSWWPSISETSSPASTLLKIRADTNSDVEVELRSADKTEVRVTCHTWDVALPIFCETKREEIAERKKAVEQKRLSSATARQWQKELERFLRDLFQLAEKEDVKEKAAARLPLAKPVGIPVSCPGCKNGLLVPIEAKGCTSQCPHCMTVFAVT